MAMRKTAHFSLASVKITFATNSYFICVSSVINFDLLTDLS